jgi:hypothetical protein
MQAKRVLQKAFAIAAVRQYARGRRSVAVMLLL